MISKATIKYIQSLQDKKHRDATGCFVAEGWVVINELLEENNFILGSIYTEESSDVPAKISGFNGLCEIITKDELQKISSRPSPKGAVAVFKKKKEKLPESLSGKISLALCDLQDPGNLGTIIRTADWFGIEHVFCSFKTADMYNPKVVQSTMASLGRVGIHYLDLEEWLKKTSITKYAATLGGKIIKPGDRIREGIILIGNEANGIPPGLLSIVDKEITIAKNGRAESLNAAVATGIILNNLAG